MARNKKKNIHYVNNAEFSQAVVDYVKIVENAKTKIPTSNVHNLMKKYFSNFCLNCLKLIFTMNRRKKKLNGFMKTD